jgi:hypothetical protein
MKIIADFGNGFPDGGDFREKKSSLLLARSRFTTLPTMA